MYIVCSSHGILLLIVIFSIYQAQCDGIPYDTIVCFGDSMSDTGNVYNLTDSKWPPAPYYQGRFSNGPVWIEKLNISNLMNYAYGSATSDNNLVVGITAFNTIVPGVRQQISIYKNSTDFKKINFARTIYVIWAGGNDYYFDPTLAPSVIVNSLINGINDLIQIGGQSFLIVNQPPLEAYPAVATENISDYLNTLTLQHNNDLSNSIQTLRSNFSNLSLYLFDVYSLITNILTNNSAYGINSTKNCWYTLNGSIIPLCTTPETYLFIDEYHFTTRIHQIIADNARKLFPMSKGTRKTSYSICFYLIMYLLFSIL